MATVQFMKMIITMTEAESDQQHIPMLVAQVPQVPDRTAYILDNSNQNPVPPMVRAGQMLAKNGVAEIAIPCITAHSFHRQMQDALPVPLINGVEETVHYLSDRGIERVGCMATEGTIRTGIFASALKDSKIDIVVPDERHQRYVSDLIYRDIKAGREAEPTEFSLVKEHLLTRGAEVVLLGCTELSLIDKSLAERSVFLDVLEVLARCCVKRFGRLKKEYRELLEK